MKEKKDVVEEEVKRRRNWLRRLRGSNGDNTSHVRGQINDACIMKLANPHNV